MPFKLTSADALDLHRASSVNTWSWYLLRLIHFSLEKSVDKGGFPESGLAWGATSASQRLGDRVIIGDRLTDDHCYELETSPKIAK